MPKKTFTLRSEGTEYQLSNTQAMNVLKKLDLFEVSKHNFVAKVLPIGADGSIPVPINASSSVTPNSP
ncbi:MAG: hypothetical protein JWQ43_2190 [Glaciihabitans sp.]|nr:hypothetical protein [Glaciihabitans sp.]